MKSLLVSISLIFTGAIAAQQPLVAGAAAGKTVAVVDGEVITASRLDALYANMPAQTRAQYDKAGGKKVFLENYVSKRLLLQEAVKNGFDQRPEVRAALEAARESALFDRYIRDVVAPEVVSDAAVRKFYDENAAKFIAGDAVKVRHIVFTTSGKTEGQARELAERVFAELTSHRATYPPNSEEGRGLFRARFAEIAKKHSEDSAAKDGGDLGWIERGQLDPKLEEVVFTIPPGIMSGIVGTPSGYHIVLVDDKKPAGAKPFEEVRRDIREFLLAQKQSEIMGAVSRRTTELRRTKQITLYPENLD